jgi:hypothetical protein
VRAACACVRARARARACACVRAHYAYALQVHSTRACVSFECAHDQFINSARSGVESREDADRRR